MHIDGLCTRNGSIIIKKRKKREMIPNLQIENFVVDNNKKIKKKIEKSSSLIILIHFCLYSERKENRTASITTDPVAIFLIKT